MAVKLLLTKRNILYKKGTVFLSSKVWVCHCVENASRWQKRRLYCHCTLRALLVYPAGYH